MTSDLTSYSGQNVLVTGAYSGIGAAAADLIELRGGRVFRLDIQEIAKPDFKKLDVSDEVNIKNVVKEILQEAKEIHAVVNSAGIAGPTSINTEDVKWADFLKTIQIDLFGSIWLTQAVLPIMKQQKYGRIVHVASIAGKEGNPGMSPYNTAKAG